MKKYVITCIVVISFVLAQYAANAQIYSASKCEIVENPGLAGQIRSGRIEKLSWMGRWHLGMYVAGWSTSFLRATGKAPVCPENLEKLPDWETKASDYEIALEKWSCMYSPWSAMDGNTKTAWCEGRKGNGIGEILIVKVDTSRPVRIWAGLGASQGLHAMNSRPKKVRIYVLQAERGYMNIGQYASGIEYRDITVLGSGVVTLRDLNGYQALPLPKHRLRGSVETIKGKGPEPVKAADSTLIAIEILSVYPGTRYADTCISEVGN